MTGGGQTLICLACLNYFRRAFGLSAWLLAVHLPIVMALIAITVAIALRGLAIPRLRGRRVAPYLVAMLPATAMTALLMLYVADFASQLWMGINITHKVVDLWVTDWWRGGHILPITPGVMAISIGAALGVFLLHVAAWGPALASVTANRSTVPRPHRRRARLTAAAIVVACAAFFYQLSWRTPRSELLSADPVLAFLRTTVAVEDDRQRGITARLRREEPLARSTYPRGLPFQRKNVVVIMVDSLRADHMQIYGYERKTTPFLAELLAAGTLKKVEFAASTCAESNCGILATLFSKTLRHQVVEDFSLFSLLKDQGYATHFILSGNHDWQGLREMYGTEHTLYFDGRDAQTVGWSDDRVIFEGLERVPDRRTPSFFFFHLMSVHLMGEKQDRFRVYQPAAVQNDWDALFRGEYDRESVTNNYDNGVLQADHTIRELFQALDRKGYLKDSVVAIVSDHGEGLGDRGPRNFGHITSLHEEMIRIPILLYDDSPEPVHNLSFATQLDVAPTIVERLGLPIPEGWEGVSLVRPAASRQTMHQTTMATPCFAVIDYSADRIYKYMHCAIGRREALYDLSADPGERINLIESGDAAVIDRLRDALERWREK